MEQQYRKYVLGLVAGLVMGSTQAAPSNSTSVMLSNFKVTLTDLAPDDGIAPAIVFAAADNAYMDQYLSYYDYGTWRDYGDAYFSTYGDHALTAPDVSLHSVAQPFELAVRLASPSQDVYAAGFSDWRLDFSLTPHTKALFTVDIDSARANDMSNTSADMRVTDWPWNNFNSETNSFEAGATQLSLTGTLVSGNDERTRTLELSVNAVMNGLTPIPEPASYGMLLAGLAVLGWRARNRRPGPLVPC